MELIKQYLKWKRVKENRETHFGPRSQVSPLTSPWPTKAAGLASLSSRLAVAQPAPLALGRGPAWPAAKTGAPLPTLGQRPGL